MCDLLIYLVSIVRYVGEQLLYLNLILVLLVKVAIWLLLAFLKVV